METEFLSAELFTPHIGSNFSLLREKEVWLTLPLTDCRTYPKGTMPGTQRTAFALLLEAPSAQMPIGHGGLFMIRHAQIGDFGPVHVGRVISTRPDVATLEIIFN